MVLPQSRPKVLIHKKITIDQKGGQKKKWCELPPHTTKEYFTPIILGLNELIIDFTGPTKLYQIHEYGSCFKHSIFFIHVALSVTLTERLDRAVAP